MTRLLLDPEEDFQLGKRGSRSPPAGRCHPPENPLAANTVPLQVLENLSENLTLWPFSFAQKMLSQVDTNADTYATVWKEQRSGGETLCGRILGKEEVTGARLVRVGTRPLSLSPAVTSFCSLRRELCLHFKTHRRCKLLPLRCSFQLPLEHPVPKAGPTVTVLDTPSHWPRHGPVTQPGPSGGLILKLTRGSLFLFGAQIPELRWQQEAGPSNEGTRGVRRNETHKERILTGF